MTSRNLTPDFSLDGIRAWKRAVLNPLHGAGIPAFAINASHDSLTAAEYRDVFGMEHHFALLHGDAAYLCFDTYAGERDATLQTTASDIDGETLRQALALLETVRAAFIVCHYPNPGENLTRLISHPRVLAVIAGHTHDNTIVPLREAGVDSDKPLLQTGHFSRAHTKRVADGCGFQPFVPMTSGDFSETGSPWQYRAVAETADGVESYIIFPEMRYAAFTSDGIDFPAFVQPYAEGQGDRSFASFDAER